MFKLGTVPFIGDYIDVAPAPAFVPTASGGWVYNTRRDRATFPVFHAVWTDNRDVRPPLDGNWANYTPPTIAGSGRAEPVRSVEDRARLPGRQRRLAQPEHLHRADRRRPAGRRAGQHQAAVDDAAARLRRVRAEPDHATKTFRMTVLAQPVGGRASFEQFPLPPYTRSVAGAADRRSTSACRRARPRRARSTSPRPIRTRRSSSTCRKSTGVGGTDVAGGLAGRVVINPDIDNPDIDNPDIDNPDIDNPTSTTPRSTTPTSTTRTSTIRTSTTRTSRIPDIDNPDIDNVARRQSRTSTTSASAIPTSTTRISTTRTSTTRISTTPTSTTARSATSPGRCRTSATRPRRST